MNERYTRIFSLQENLYKDGSPIVIKAGALLKDNESSWLIAQLKLQNISNLPIKLVKIELICFDSLDRELDQKVTHQYLDINVTRGESFGSQAPIRISNQNARSFTVRILEVGFTNNSVWSDDENKLTTLPTQKSINELITDIDAVSGYKITYGNNANLIPIEHGDIWLCTCGEINHNYEENCYKCNANLASLKSIDIDILKQENIYSSATELFKVESIDSLKEASSLFEKISGYKDSENLKKLCEEKSLKLKIKKATVNKKRNKIIKISAILSGTALVLGLLGYFVAYPLIAKFSGNFATYINMYNIEEFEIPEGTKVIKDGAFANCENLKSVIIPDSVTEIGKNAFYECNNIKNVVIPDSVTTIGNKAFYECDGLESIEIPDSVISIGGYAFNSCNNLKSVKIGNGIKSIGDCAWAGSTPSFALFIDEISPWCTVEYIANPHLSNPISCCKELYVNGTFTTDLIIPEGVTYINEDAFYACDILESITIPDGVTTIGDYAFSNCYNLTYITIPDSVTQIGYNAFSSCNSLTSVTIPDSVTQIGYNAFSSCDSLTSVTIPDSVTSIGPSAFAYCRSLTSVTIPDSVTSIGNSAFENCSSLTSVTIPDSVTTIGARAFANCDKLKNITFEDPYGWSTPYNNFSNYDLIYKSNAAQYLSYTYCDYTWEKS